MDTATCPTLVVTERGDPVLAAQLAEQAQAVAASDPRQALRLLIAAGAIAPDRAEHRIALAGTMLGSVAPERITGGSLGGGGPVRYAALSADESFVIVNRAGGGQLWQLRGFDSLFRLATALDTRVLAAAAGEHAYETTILTNGAGGVDRWVAVRTASGSLTRHLGRIAGPAAAVAVSGDGQLGVSVVATTATVWDLSFHTRLVTTVSYHAPVTSIELPASDAVVLVAGHADGSLTIDRLDLDRNASVRQTLRGGGAPVAAVTLSSNGATALAIGGDGTLTVWQTTPTPAPASAVAPSGTARAGGAGPYRAWLSPDGSYALIAGWSGPPAVWSLADPAQPARIGELGVGTDPAVPAMVSLDGATLVSIDRDNTLTVWNLAPVVDTLDDPLSRACALAGLTEQAWRQIVPDPTYPNPCPPPAGPPTVTVHTGPPASPAGPG